MNKDYEILEALLNRLNEDGAAARGDTASPSEAAGDAAELAELRALGASLRAAPSVDTGHFSFHEIQMLADARRTTADGAEWEMPEHLSTCPLCLEAFEATLEGLPVTSPALTTRAAGLLTTSGLSITSSDEASATGIPRLALKLPTTSGRKHPSRWLRGLATAAALAIICSLGYYAYLRSTSVRAVDGGLAVVDEDTKTPITPGSVIPSNSDLVALADTRTAFHDGTEVHIEKDTRLTIDESLGGDTTLNLKEGSLTAKVAKQKPGRHFDVTTALGTVRVIGTRFSVSTRSENADVNYSAGEQTWKSQHVKLTAVTVTVTDGTVSVTNTQKNQVSVTAGQTAVIRENEALIDVSGISGVSGEAR